VFCDTSALMKLYAAEAHSEWTRAQVMRASHCVVSQITWVEMCAAFGLKERTNQVSATECKLALKRLHAEWPSLTRMGLDAPLLTQAGELALQWGLRAYDSLQLATAGLAHAQLGKQMVFLCFDKKLQLAAQEMGLTIADPSTGTPASESI
jgi:uncharacterized protein